MVAAVMCLGDSVGMGSLLDVPNATVQYGFSPGSGWGCGDGLSSGGQRIDTLATLLRRRSPQLVGMASGNCIPLDAGGMITMATRLVLEGGSRKYFGCNTPPSHMAENPSLYKGASCGLLANSAAAKLNAGDFYDSYVTQAETLHARMQNMTVPAGWKVLTVGPFSQDTAGLIGRAGHGKPGAFHPLPSRRLTWRSPAACARLPRRDPRSRRLARSG
jgi:hypothetical protein